MPARANRVEPPQVRSRGKLSRPKSTRAYIWTGLIWSVRVILNPRGGMTAPVPAPAPRYRGCPIPGSRCWSRPRRTSEEQAYCGIDTNRGRTTGAGAAGGVAGRPGGRVTGWLGWRVAGLLGYWVTGLLGCWGHSCPALLAFTTWPIWGDPR